METKQTAVEWLFSQLPDHLRLSRNGFDTLQIAKTIERQQIEDAYFDGGTDLPLSETMCQEYYEQKYVGQLK